MKKRKRARDAAQVVVSGRSDGGFIDGEQIKGDRLVKDVWLEVPLEEAEGWLAAYRLVPVKGRPVVAEVRLFPNERRPRRRSTDRWSEEPGEWSAAKLGCKAAAPVRGVSSKALRAVRPSKHMEEFWSLIVPRWKEEIGDEAFTELGFHGAFDEPQNRRPGRAGYGDFFYAQWAERYAYAAGQTRKPIQLLVQQSPRPAGRTFEDIYIRDLIRDARKRNLLTKASPGVAGGELTAKARRILREGRKSKLIRTQKEVKGERDDKE